MSEENKDRRAGDHAPVTGVDQMEGTPPAQAETPSKPVEIREMFGPPPPPEMQQLESEVPLEDLLPPEEKAKPKKRKLVFLPNRKKKKAQAKAQAQAQAQAEAPVEVTLHEIPASPAGPAAPGAPAPPVRRGKKKRRKKKKKGKKGKKKSPVLLIVLMAAAVIVVAGLVFLVIKLIMSDPPPEDLPPEESVSAPVESDEPTETPEATPTPTPKPTPKPTPTPSTANTNQQEAVEYIGQLTPEALGLEGESMDQYQLFASEKLVLVSGIPCVEVSVYSDENPTGTNDIKGRYLLSRTSPKRLFLVDEEAGTAVELPLDGVKVSAPAPETPVPAEGQTGAPEGAENPENSGE